MTIRKIKIEEAALGAKKIAEWAKRNYINRVFGLPKGGAILANMVGYYGLRVEDRADRDYILSGTLIVDDVMGRGTNLTSFIYRQKQKIERSLSRATDKGRSKVVTSQEFKSACLFWFENDEFKPDFYVYKLRPGDKVSFPYQPKGWAEQRLNR